MARSRGAFDRSAGGGLSEWTLDLAEAKEAEGRMRVQETGRRRDAEQRIRELEEELRKLRGEG